MQKEFHSHYILLHAVNPVTAITEWLNHSLQNHICGNMSCHWSIFCFNSSLKKKCIISVPAAAIKQNCKNNYVFPTCFKQTFHLQLLRQTDSPNAHHWLNHNEMNAEMIHFILKDHKVFKAAWPFSPLKDSLISYQRHLRGLSLFEYRDVSRKSWWRLPSESTFT